MAVVTYTRAVQRNLIKGLATYNILQNPTYKEAFAITWKFAMTNKNVRSVRNNKVTQRCLNSSQCNLIFFDPGCFAIVWHRRKLLPLRTRRTRTKWK